MWTSRWPVTAGAVWYPCRYPAKSQSVAKRWHPTALGIQDWKAGKLPTAGPLRARLGQCTTGALTPAYGPLVVRNAGTQHFAPKRNSPDEVVVLLGKLSLQLSGERTKKALHQWQGSYKVYTRFTRGCSGWITKVCIRVWAYLFPVWQAGAVRRLWCWWLCWYQPHREKRLWAYLVVCRGLCAV